MKKLFSILLTLCLILAPIQKGFGEVVVSATLDSTALMIGDQCDLHLEATCQPDERVLLPVYGETLVPGIDIVDRTIIDTITLPDGRIRLHQYLTVTSFQDSLFYINPLPFVKGNSETIWSEGLTLNVIQPFEVDTTLAITDIKPIERAPIWWWGIIRWVLLGLLIVALAVAAWLAWRKWGYLLRGTEKPVAEEPVVLRPAEEVALEKLDLIKQEKVWQQGQTKEYHTQLTDVIREYIARRFDVRSTEKTSDETLRELRGRMQDQRELYDSLRRMLTLADLVKFAKWTTTPEENENALRTAYDFVEATTPKIETT